ncbi:WGR domain-containing protein [Burkholderia multivorans]|uniref:WGR domain-containing protein n=1 Tax=Burkholderia multivorans TaxID=87883 RepID=UPI0028668AC5|nr:WGR domain-containing protein [Burkholderia multivorans]MDR9095487.1 hypothetical protein [Burkholderia multivorans]MDR9119266.1 hypothetical protein [Burkholderia multivorans]MDR9158931.1 hypothetical protein [Burkholderia multivorans]MDR9166327.1 hypothetical protein [Burkholderia multivorans]MDR9252953.1 hypothetical protein [Burkholderia multivorans]
MQLEFQTPSRGYTVILVRDLFGDYVLYRRWYGLHCKRWGTKRQVFFSEDAALATLRRIVRTRQRHGYMPIGEPSDQP